MCQGNNPLKKDACKPKKFTIRRSNSKRIHFIKAKRTNKIKRTNSVLKSTPQFQIIVAPSD